MDSIYIMYVRNLICNVPIVSTVAIACLMITSLYNKISLKYVFNLQLNIWHAINYIIMILNQQSLQLFQQSHNPSVLLLYTS